jgi:hypothetical protein
MEPTSLAEAWGRIRACWPADHLNLQEYPHPPLAATPPRPPLARFPELLRHNNELSFLRNARLVPPFLLVAWCAHAGEYAVLASGSRLRVDRHEMENAKIRMYSNGGMTELDAAAVARFEPDEELPAVKPQPAPATPALDLHALVDAVAAKYHIPSRFLHSVVQAESGYSATAVSPKGAVGLMQLMPSTAKIYGADPQDPAQNVEAGARYLAELLLKYDGGVYHALAAYNAGPRAVEKYNGIPPYRETQDYIHRILRDWMASK